jgi:hypothetical protein
MLQGSLGHLEAHLLGQLHYGVEVHAAIIMSFLHDDNDQDYGIVCGARAPFRRRDQVYRVLESISNHLCKLDARQRC